MKYTDFTKVKKGLDRKGFFKGMLLSCFGIGLLGKNAIAKEVPKIKVFFEIHKNFLIPIHNDTGELYWETNHYGEYCKLMAQVNGVKVVGTIMPVEKLLNNWDKECDKLMSIIKTLHHKQNITCNYQFVYPEDICKLPGKEINYI